MAKQKRPLGSVVGEDSSFANGLAVRNPVFGLDEIWEGIDPSATADPDAGAIVDWAVIGPNTLAIDQSWTMVHFRIDTDSSSQHLDLVKRWATASKGVDNNATLYFRFDLQTHADRALTQVVLQFRLHASKSAVLRLRIPVVGNEALIASLINHRGFVAVSSIRSPGYGIGLSAPAVMIASPIIDLVEGLERAGFSFVTSQDVAP